MGLFRKKKADSLSEERGAYPVWDGGGFTYNGISYSGGTANGLGLTPSDGANPLSAGRPTVTGDLESVVAAATPNSVVSAAVLTRSLVLSQLWFEFEDWGSGKRFRHRDLSIFEKPGDQTTLPRLLSEAEMSQSYAGNTYIWLDRARGRLRVLRPDMVSVVLGSDAPPSVLAEAERAPAAERREAM